MILAFHLGAISLPNKERIRALTSEALLSMGVLGPFTSNMAMDRKLLPKLLGPRAWTTRASMLRRRGQIPRPGDPPPERPVEMF